MAFWSRFPKGTYVRQSPEWFARSRARAFVQLTFTTGYVPALALVNQSSPPVYLHVISINDSLDNPDPILTYINGMLPANPAGDTVVTQGPQPIYTDQPMPPGQVMAGAAAPYDANIAVSSFVDYSLPPWEVCVIAPGMGLQLLADKANPGAMYATFDYYWAVD